jgi:hypothetical protein
MAEKGAYHVLMPLVRQTYIETGKLSLAAEKHGVSRQTATEWKNKDGDEWDKARERKSTFGLRMESLLERELTYAEDRKPGTIEGGTLDNLSKIGALVVKFKAVEGQGSTYDKAKVFLENMQWIVTWLRENDPEGLKVLAADFDAMTMAYKSELMGGRDSNA